MYFLKKRRRKKLRSLISGKTVAEVTSQDKETSSLDESFIISKCEVDLFERLTRRWFRRFFVITVDDK